MSPLQILPLLLGLASAALTSLKDGAALDSFLGKQDVALIEIYDEKEGRAMPSDLEEAAKLLDLGDVAATARVAGVEAVKTKFELTGSLPVLHLFVKGKPYGDEFGEDRSTETAAAEIAAFARQKVKEAREEGVLKEKGEVEEMKSSRGDRLCFKAEGICVIYLANGQASSEEIGVLTKLKKRNMSKLSSGGNARGTTLNWSWLDATAEPAFAALLNGDPAELPGLVIYNPHKRPRHFSLEEGTAANEDSIQAALDKLLGGDARFTPAKGQKLPTFAGKAEL